MYMLSVVPTALSLAAATALSLATILLRRPTEEASSSAAEITLASCDSADGCVAVLTPWNVALLLLGLCCVQCATAHASPPPLLYAARALFALALLACAARNGGAYLAAQYPALLLLPAVACIDPRHAAPLVSGGLATLAITLVGSRDWADALAHLALLTGAAHLMEEAASSSSSERGGRSVLLLAIGLAVLSWHLAQAQFGPQDSWRYALAFVPAACALTAPLLEEEAARAAMRGAGLLSLAVLLRALAHQ